MSWNLYYLLKRRPGYIQDLTDDDKRTWVRMVDHFALLEGDDVTGADHTRYEDYKEEDEETVDLGGEESIKKDLDEGTKTGKGLNRLQLLLASNLAGNTGVINEITDILKHLY